MVGSFHGIQGIQNHSKIDQASKGNEECGNRIDMAKANQVQLLFFRAALNQCLIQKVGDEGNGHSPIYGFAADGYALYGPYESAGVLAVSGWEMRDYGASSSQGGCDTAGQRSCILNDAYDLTQGVDSVTNGPDIGASVSTLSGNTLAATDGYYLEDYYYSGDQTSLSYRLDQHNGHDNNDGRGYHYHITLVLDDDKLVPRFPFTFGPRFYGDLPGNAMTSCGAAGGPGGPPPKAELSLR